MFLSRTLLSGPNTSSARVLSSARESKRTKSVWPRFKPRKDKHAVLDALAKTVKPIYPQIAGRGPGDPFLYRFDAKSLVQYAQHWLTGSRAADYVIDRNPEFFPGFRSNPKFVPDPAPLPGKEPTVENLKRLVALRRGEESHQMYSLLRSDHPDVILPLSLKNDLLELMLFYGVGQPWIHFNKEVDKHYSELEKFDPEETPSRFDSAYFTGGIKRWNADSPSHILFQEMKAEGIADADTYIAYLHGLALYDKWPVFYELYLEMLELNLHPSLSIHNILLYAVTNRFRVKLPEEEVGQLVMRVIEKMNTPPIVSPNYVTFNHILKAVGNRGNLCRNLPSFYNIYHEMLSRGISPNLQQFTFLLHVDYLNLDYVTNYIKAHPEIVTWTHTYETMYFFSHAVSLCLKRRKMGYAEFYMQLNRETLGMFNSGENTCDMLYLKHKIEKWRIENAEEADELYTLLREHIHFGGKVGSLVVSLIKRFASIGRYDLTMKVMCELFLLSEGYFADEVARVFALFNWFVSDIVMKNEPITSDIARETADLVWLVIGRFERHGISNEDCFSELCALAMKLYKELDEKKNRKIAKWLEGKKKIRERYSSDNKKIRERYTSDNKKISRPLDMKYL